MHFIMVCFDGCERLFSILNLIWFSAFQNFAFEMKQNNRVIRIGLKWKLRRTWRPTQAHKHTSTPVHKRPITYVRWLLTFCSLMQMHIGWLELRIHLHATISSCATIIVIYLAFCVCVSGKQLNVTSTAMYFLVLAASNALHSLAMQPKPDGESVNTISHSNGTMITLYASKIDRGRERESSVGFQIILHSVWKIAVVMSQKMWSPFPKSINLTIVQCA